MKRNVWVTIAAVSFALLVATAMPVQAFSIGDNTFSDGFEDGDLDEYDTLDSDESLNDFFVITGSEAYEGTHYFRGTTTGWEAQIRVNEVLHPERDVTVNQGELNVSFALRVEGYNDYGFYTSGVELTNGSEVIQAGFYTDDQGVGDPGGWYVRDDQGDLIKTSSGVNTTYKQPDAGPWQKVKLHLDFTDNVYNMTVNGTEVVSGELADSYKGDITPLYGVHWRNDGTSKGNDAGTYNTDIDDIRLDATFVPEVNLTGTVTDGSGDPLKGVSVVANESSSDSVNGSATTDASGFYQIDLPTGNTYDVEASKDGYETKTKSITLDSLSTLDFTLNESTIELDVDGFMEHGSSQPFTVTSEGTDVTDQATVTSSNSTIVFVDNANNELEATADTSINAQVTITAEYQNMSDSKTVTVANKTINNIAILPPPTWPSALFGGGGDTSPLGDTTGASDVWPGAVQLQLIFLAISIGATVGWITGGNPWASLGAAQIILIGGWAMDYAADGFIIASLFAAAFLALTVSEVTLGGR